jgi:tripartite-type tricarboxylate transporter receptor subunit TctC
MLQRRKFLAAGAFTSLAAPFPQQVLGARPVQIIVPFAAGGTTDVVARIIGRSMTAEGTAVMVDNRPGASGAIAATFVARVQPQSATSLFGGLATNVVLPLTQSSLSYDAEKELKPVARLCAVDFVLVVSAASRFKTLEQLLAAAAKSENALTFASTGNLGSLHLVMEYLCKRAGVKMVHVPYKGEIQGVIDLQEGRVELAPMSAGLVKPIVEQGRLRALATLSATRIDSMPDVPTVAECGFQGFGFPTWNGLFVPTEAPQPMIARLERASLAAARSSAVADQMRKLGVAPAPQTAAEFSEFLMVERQRWRALIKETGVL